MSDVAITAEHLAKRFRLGETIKYTRLGETLAGGLGRLVGRRPPDKHPELNLWALEDVSFEVGRGQVMGLVGRNGAGKSVLLKILARIVRPTKGYAEVRGRVGSLIEVGTGFHPELTGRENAYLNGSILGMSKAHVRAKFDDIVGFAELERFIDTPVKRYSSGMKVRLGFAVAAQLEPDILLVDEVLAVGDVGFRQRSRDRMREIADSGTTVCFVGHNVAVIRSLCEVGLLIEEGKIVKRGDIDEVVDAYEHLFIGEVKAESAGRMMRLDSWGILTPAGPDPQTLADISSPVRMGFHVDAYEETEMREFKIMLREPTGVQLGSWLLPGFRLPKGPSTVVVDFPALPMRPGLYKVEAFFRGERPAWDRFTCVPLMSVTGKDFLDQTVQRPGVLNLPVSVEVTDRVAG